MNVSAATEPVFGALFIIVVLPLFVFGFITIYLRKYPKVSGGLSVFCVLAGFCSAIYLFLYFLNSVAPTELMLRVISSGSTAIPIGLLLDPLSLLMLVIVTGIALVVQCYSLGYMSDDPGFARYYGYMSLFVWSMANMVLASSILQLFIFWELVGLSSYLLIGFWIEKFSATRAGRKAFVMTRIGDVSFFLGLLLLLAESGRLGILSLNSWNPAESVSPAVLTLAVLLVFGGIIGKSAQFPLMTWLPDAMEGPTPVSALLHSATMVAAGVFLFARLFPLFSLSQTAMTITLAVGTISMLISATMAMVSRDIKQVWAYSTISQLGFMIMGLGAGSYIAGVFHLTTHAVFKALLFLCAGVFIHQFETNDMFEIGRRGGRKMRIPIICLIIAAAALSGIWPLSGFFSKELIISGLLELHNPTWIICAFIGIFLTAYYTFRLVFILLFPKEFASPGKQELHFDLSYKLMVIPLLVLALLTLVLGLVETPISRYLGPDMLTNVHHEIWPVAASMALVAIAIGFAWFEYGRKQSTQTGFIERFEPVRSFFAQRWYMDHLFAWINVKFVNQGAAEACKNTDLKVIDGVIRGVCHSLVETGRTIAKGHLIQIQSRLAVIFAVVFGFTTIMLLIY